MPLYLKCSEPDGALRDHSGIVGDGPADLPQIQADVNNSLGWVREYWLDGEGAMFTWMECRGCGMEAYLSDVEGAG